LSDLPVNQAIAVTGSVNQNGEVQAIGGANEKIEGYFEICKAIGLTGEQGVVIPESNVDNLMLKESVVEAIQAGRFHIWPVRTIDEGIEVLTGVKAGVRQADGKFDVDSVNARIDQRLGEMAETLQRFGKENGRQKEEAENVNDGG
jgi:predicted ATP-dependent protease